MTWDSFRWHVGYGVDYFNLISFPELITDINDAGQIVGGGPGPGAKLISDGTLVLLFGYNGTYSMASAINNAGHITGYVVPVPGTDRIKHVFLYADGAIQDLGTMGGASSDAQDINLVDEIVGSAETSAGTRAFLYANSRFTDLGSLGGISSQATGINDAGQIVGWSTLAGEEPQQQRAFLYVNGTMYDLNDLVEPLPLRLREAPKINNRGQIIANACAPPGYTTDCHAYLLTPVTPP
jgi:probable HAF family extracellular repeat protein